MSQSDLELHTGLQAKLDLDGSPERIAARLRALWPKQSQRHLNSHGTA